LTTTKPALGTVRGGQALAVAATAMLLAAFVGTASNLAIPILERDFPNAGLTTISWVVSAFNVSQVTFMLLGGRLADRIGRKKIFLRGLAVFVVGAGLSGVAPTIELVIAARIVQAVGVALMLPSSLAAVLPQYPKERHGTVVSLWSSMGVLGAATAPVVAAVVLTASGWRALFLVAIPIALTALFFGRRVLTDGLVADSPRPLDPVGVLTGTTTMAGLTITVVQGSAWGWADQRILAIAAVTVLSAAAFVRTSLRHEEPLLDFALFRIPTFWVVTLAGGLIATSTAATWFLFPLFLTEVWGYSILQVGLAMTPGPVILVLVAPFAGRLVDSRGYRGLLVLGAAFATAGTAWMSWRLQPGETYLRAFFPGTVAIGLGMAFMLGPANAAALQHVPPAQLGAANAAYNTARMTGGAMGVAITTAIVGNAAVGTRLTSFQESWWTMTAIMAIAPLLLWFRYPAANRSAS